MSLGFIALPVESVGFPGASCKDLRLAKVNTIPRFFLVQYPIVFLFYFAKRSNHPDPS